MTTVDDLMAGGVPDMPNPHRARLALTAMGIAAAAITAAGAAAFAGSDLSQLIVGRGKSHAAAPAHQRVLASGDASSTSR